MDDIKRPSAFRFMLTPQEHEALRVIASGKGITMSMLLRVLVFGERYESQSSVYPQKDHSDLLAERIETLGRIPFHDGVWPLR